ncbi:MAG: hypothetical protein J3K34DRAFT_61055 [Monoraphidium minutum]|nr:MAG: hypothetical protein J3K34DRAFT_61055 [Monoraphidium minutum]
MLEPSEERRSPTFQSCRFVNPLEAQGLQCPTRRSRGERLQNVAVRVHSSVEALAGPGRRLPCSRPVANARPRRARQLHRSRAAAAAEAAAAAAAASAAAAAMADDGDDDFPSCSVCLTPFDAEERKPWDLGCGHSFCEGCMREHPRSFRNCPECRARANLPHVNIALMRALGRPAAVRGPTTRQQSRRQEQQQQQQARPSIPDLLGGRGGGGGGAAAAPRIQGNTIAAAAALAAAAQQALRQRRQGGAHQRPEVAAWKASVWTWLGPLLALLYILSPLDAIPDFIPLIGWVDDILVALYLATTLYGRAAGAARR